MLWETFRLALQALRRNALRSFLTVLGIVIGVGAVIAMVTIGNGTTVKVADDLSKLGSNLLFVRPGQFGPGRSSAEARAFTAKDVAALKAQLRGVKAVAPVAQTSGTAIVGTESRATSIIGSDNDFFISQDWPLSAGREFLGGEIRGGRAVCLIGATVRDELFGPAFPIGQRVRVNKVSCEVIGLLEAKGQSSFGTDRDDVILMPLRTFQRRIAGNTNISTIYVSAQDGVETSKVQQDIERLLRERRGITGNEEDDFSVRDMKQIAQTLTSTTAMMTALLGAVAGVSLLVGGIGIMNIMLVSVTERTREIGIRLAIGAQASQVLMQFLVEAVVLSMFGGIVGILSGLGLALLASSTMNIPFMLDWKIVVIAFAFSAAVGILFGFFPARRAARLDPIEALRHE
ncbi:ABC transporter permease [Roseibium aggregatum]|uniref:FtsX-like permease family protein n=1 Tax=Roseibium aggregatum TaxID=187304 RepID=A0A926S6T7_9HYPH|nr:ABC transporter permease [Roseibium aggregatum]MBD1547555.1 FtsX-like permease family protein [Roseibium aggregatum]